MRILNPDMANCILIRGYDRFPPIPNPGYNYNTEESLNFLSVAVQIQKMIPNMACWQPSRSSSADPFGKFCTVILSFPTPTANLFHLSFRATLPLRLNFSLTQPARGRQMQAQRCQVPRFKFQASGPTALLRRPHTAPPVLSSQQLLCRCYAQEASASNTLDPRW